MSPKLKSLPQIVILVVIGLTAGCQSVSDPSMSPPLQAGRGHAHNDYEHERPLLDAMAAGFSSVEADVHLVDGALLVAHDADEVRPGRTLQSLYLDPLREAFRSQSGEISPNGDSFILLIDFKTAAESTYRALESILNDYRSMLTTYRDGITLPGPVTVILSGNRPIQLVAKQSDRLVAIDGRLPDLSTSLYSNHVIPLVSDNWNSHFDWRGEGPIPEWERQKLVSIVQQAHHQGRLIRFWANPDIPAYWKLAQNSGVDLINTDNLDGLSRFLAPQESTDTP